MLSILSRNSYRWVGLLAVIGLLFALAVMLVPTTVLPPELVTDLIHRAQIGSSIATVFALGAGIAAIGAAVWINSSDFKAEQDVKADTAMLRAALRSMMVKGAHLLGEARPDYDSCIDFESDRRSVNNFLTSTTAFGYWVWVERRGGETPVGQDEPWRGFFLLLAQLLSACNPNDNPRLVVCRAAAAERMLASLSSADITTISESVRNLAGQLGTARESTDTLLAAVIASCIGSGATTAPGTAERKASTVSDTQSRMRALKDRLDKAEQSDPDVDLFVAVFDNDVEAAKDALSRGANQSATDNEVLARHGG